jgi:DNA polymerase III subunit chi
LTEVAFHFNAPDSVAYACRLLRKAVSAGAKVVTGTPATLKQLDVALWTFAATDFVPHCLLRGDPRVIAASPVILTTLIESAPHREVLLNLGDSIPLGFDLFERVIEVVSLDEEERLAARSRWTEYTRLGYQLQRHDLILNGGAQ